jgi:hypothetical protein
LYILVGHVLNNIGTMAEEVNQLMRHSIMRILLVIAALAIAATAAGAPVKWGLGI